uniref:ghrelin/obestatin prepropeptide n=1 Tax=Scatophagus argus TaxID=75038 RepID=UPI001ED84A6C|nr:ghrelin/obestatin prepropeptide [Scatophagus argus]
MFLKTNTCMLVFLLCSMSLWVKSISAGSSFLSPSQKPQYRGRPSRVGRHVMEEPRQPSEDKHIKISTPFEIGITMREGDYGEYGRAEDYDVALQEIIQRLLENTETAEIKPPPQL